MIELDITKWTKDGRGAVEAVAEDEFKVIVETPLTLWCPQEASDSVDIEFDCHLHTPNTQMLVMACARSWRGAPLLEVARTGAYDDYNADDLELYTVGFNRTRPATDHVQPNAGMANVRRIGGPEFVRYAGVSSAQDLARWLAWDLASDLVSVREPITGTARYYHHRMRFDAPKISYWLEGEELFTVVDHRPQALAGGHFGIRCMTPEAVFSIRKLAVGRVAAD